MWRIIFSGRYVDVYDYEMRNGLCFINGDNLLCSEDLVNEVISMGK